MKSAINGITFLFLFFVTFDVLSLEALSSDELDVEISEMPLKRGKAFRNYVQFSGAMALDTTRSLRGVDEKICKSRKWVRIEGSFSHCWNQQSNLLMEKIAYFQQFRKTPIKPIYFNVQLSAEGQFQNIEVLGVEENPAVKKQFIALLSEMGFGRAKKSNDSIDLSIVVETLTSEERSASLTH